MDSNYNEFDSFPFFFVPGHPSTRAMVYHCGNNGAFEALYHGVPIIGIPVFADQTDVAYRIMSNGIGLVVEVPQLTNESLYRAMSEVIENPTYVYLYAYKQFVLIENGMLKCN